MKQKSIQKKNSPKQKSSKKTGINIWIVATIVLGACLFALGAFAIGSRFVDKSINNDNNNSNSSNSESISDAQNNVTVNNSNNCVQINEGGGSGCAVSFEEKENYMVLFYESGLKLNLGTGFEFIKLEYDGDLSEETVYIGGLSLNNGRAQNTPAFSSGNCRKREGDSDVCWDWLARIDVYDRERWYGPRGLQGAVSEKVANGERPPFETVLDNFGWVVIYSAQPTLTGAMQWQTDWETETINLLGDRIKNVDNWSKYK